MQRFKTGPEPSDAREDTEAEVHRNIERLLNDPKRIPVSFTFSLHNMSSVDGGMRLHLVLKFKYDDRCIPLFGARRPENEVEKRYGEAHRLFPYCIFNSIDETPISWTYQNVAGKVYERVELFTTVTMIEYMRYYPFVLKVLNLKVGSDGTAKTGVLNLLPELKAGTNEPDVDFGVFTKGTSAYRIAPDGVETGDVICRMVVRDLTSESLGNLSGVYTRVYTILFFEASWIEDTVKYIIVSLLLLNLTLFLPAMEVADLIAIVLAIALTEVALLFVMPHTNEVTTAESVLLGHATYVIAAGFVVGLSCNQSDPDDDTASEVSLKHMLFANAAMTLTTIAWCMKEYRAYRALVNIIKNKFRATHAFVGMFAEIDREI